MLKRSGEKVPFDRQKVAAGVGAAAKGRNVSDDQIQALAEEVEDEMRLAAAGGAEVTTSLIGHAVLDQLRSLDEVAYMRFASVYKNFDAAEDFQREVAQLDKSPIA